MKSYRRPVSSYRSISANHTEPATQHVNINRMCSRQMSFMTDEDANKKKPTEFDIWNLIKRPNTTEAYVLTSRYRTSKAPIRRVKTSVGIRRRRRPESRADSEGESNHSVATSEFDFDMHFPEEFDFDAEPEDLLNDPKPPPKIGTPSQELYKRACKFLKVVPVSYFLRNLNKEKIIMPYHPLGTQAIKACAMALMNNTDVQLLNLTGDDIGVEGVGYIADMLRENTFITDLSLAENPLGVEGAKKILDVLTDLDNVITLNLSGIGLVEKDAEQFENLFAETNHLKKLNLSHNEFREVGGRLFGEYLTWNDTIEDLDLSWNHLRMEGAIAIAEGLQENRGLKVLNLSWNGFHAKGCERLAKALEKNSELTELDLTCNRINKDCLTRLMAGVKKNTTLRVLKLGWNPITSVGAMELLTTIEENNIPLEEVDIHTQLVEKSFVELAKRLEKERGLRVRYGMVRGQDPMEGSLEEEYLLEENPSVVLMEFMRLMGFRPIDLLSALDKDKSNSLDRDEIKFGLRFYCIPLTDRCLDHLIEKLDVDGDGHIDLSEIMSAKAQHRLKENEMHKAAGQNIALEETEVGRVRLKLQKLMSRKMDGNPTFKARVELFREAISQGKLRSAMEESMQKKQIIKDAVLAKRHARKKSAIKGGSARSRQDSNSTLSEDNDSRPNSSRAMSATSRRSSRPGSAMKISEEIERPLSSGRIQGDNVRQSSLKNLASPGGSVDRHLGSLSELHDLISTGADSKLGSLPELKGSNESLNSKLTSDRTSVQTTNREWVPLNV